jgi:hypothetical protein
MRSEVITAVLTVSNLLECYIHVNLVNIYWSLTWRCCLQGLLDPAITCYTSLFIRRQNLTWILSEIFLCWAVRPWCENSHYVNSCCRTHKCESKLLNEKSDCARVKKMNPPRQYVFKLLRGLPFQNSCKLMDASGKHNSFILGPAMAHVVSCRGLSLWRSGVNPRWVHKRFVVDKAEV